jgi:hypothetical protein
MKKRQRLMLCFCFNRFVSNSEHAGQEVNAASMEKNKCHVSGVDMAVQVGKMRSSWRFG